MRNRISSLLLFFILISSSVLGQTKLGSFVEYGENNASFGSTARFALTSDFKLKGHGISLATQTDIKDDSYNAFSGALIKINRDIKIKEKPIMLEGFFLYTPEGSIQYQTNWGLLLHFNYKKSIIKLGTNFRTYAYTSSAKEEYNMPDESVHENWNLFYLLQYHLKPIDYKWNASIAITNFDYFIINQETNPFFLGTLSYKLSPKLKCYAEGWYKTSGIMNGHIDYFGYNLKTGIVWEL